MSIKELTFIHNRLIAQELTDLLRIEYPPHSEAPEAQPRASERFSHVINS